jgi:hypothetical protein
MKNFDWSPFIRQSAERAGFREGTLLRDQSFSLGGEVSPSVQASFQTVTRTQVAPVVYFGVYIPEFEREWRDRLRQVATKSADLGGAPPFLSLAANAESLRRRPWPAKTPSSEDVAEMREWFGKVFDHAKCWPHSMEGLVSSITGNDMGGEELWAITGHPVKVRGLVQWLRRAHGVDVAKHLLPLLRSGTDPYDVSVMLDDPTT